MQCIDHDRGVRCLNPTQAGDSLCLTHRSHVGEASARAREATMKAIAQANARAAQATAGATDSWLGATKTETFDHTIPQSSASWTCTEPECHRCNHHRCHWILERTRQFCGFAGRPDRPFCINHDPQARDEHRAQSSRGGRARRTAVPVVDPPGLEISLYDRSGIQAVLHAVITAELLGQISPIRSRNIVRALAVATRNFDNNPNRTPAEQSEDYSPRSEYILAFLTNVLEEAAITDAPPESDTPPPQLTDDTALALKLLKKLAK